MEDQIPRTCANCACKTIQENAMNKLEQQMFCRKDPPMATQWRGEKPRMKDGKVVMDRHDKPIMEPTQEIIYLYKPTLAGLVCFDGWRPQSTLPGERHEINELVQPLMDNLNAAMGNLLSDITEQRALNTAIDDGGKKN